MFEGHLVISKSPYINDGKSRGWKKKKWTSASCRGGEGGGGVDGGVYPYGTFPFTLPQKCLEY